MSEPVSGPPAGPGESGQSIAERMLDLFVYLPAGVLLTAVDDTSGTMSKGRTRVDQELRNAQFVGRLAVEIGLRQLRGRVESLAVKSPEATDARGSGNGKEDARAAGRHTPKRTVPTRTAPSPATRSHTSRAAASRTRTEQRAPTPPGDLRVDRAIPEYDILAASQVVRRLDGLDDRELRAVLRYEQATRARRTILQRAEQLLERPDGVPEDEGPVEPGGAG